MSNTIDVDGTGKQATANHVPAAAVIRRWQALSELLGVKRAQAAVQVHLKSVGLNPMRGWKLQGWEVSEGRWNS